MYEIRKTVIEGVLKEVICSVEIIDELYVKLEVLDNEQIFYDEVEEMETGFKLEL